MTRVAIEADSRMDCPLCLWVDIIIGTAVRSEY